MATADMKRFLVFFVGTTSLVVFSVFHASKRADLTPLPALSTSPTTNTSRSRAPLRHNCSDVITNMLYGHWDESNVTQAQRLKMYNYYDQGLKRRGVTYGLERPDRRCGNVYYDWYRALCHPGGPTPCCRHSLCQSAPPGNCSCPDCWDLRDQIEADLATWRADNEACQPRKMAAREICSLLANATVFFIGDSLIRHLYVSFVMLAKGMEDGVFHYEGAPDELSALCRGSYLFSHIKCRHVVLQSPAVCDGAANTKFLELRRTRVANDIVRTILSLSRVARSLVVFGVGVDDRFNAKLIQQRIWTPLLNKMKAQKSPWPRIVGTTPHVIGPIKAVAKNYHAEFNQDSAHMRNFTYEMMTFLKARGIPVLSSYNITMGVMSHDGTHYGIGVNILRARALLHHIEELASRGLW